MKKSRFLPLKSLRVHEKRKNLKECPEELDLLKRGLEEVFRERLRLKSLIEKCKETFEHAPVSLLCLDRKGIIRKANSTASQLLKMKKSALIDRDFGGFICPEYHEAYEQHLKKARYDGERAVCSVLLITGDGSNCHATVDIMCVEEHESDLCFRMFITEAAPRSFAAPLPTEGEKKYRNLFENSPISLWEEDFSRIKQALEELRSTGVRDFRAWFDVHPESVLELASLVKIIDVNEKTLELYKAKNKKEFQKNLAIFFCLESYDEVKEELIAIAEGKTEFEKETVNQTLEGEKLHIYLRWTAVPGYEESLAKVIICIVDITSQKLAARRLESTRKEFLSFLTHDLKSPLASIMAYTQLIGRLVEDRPDVRKNVAIVKNVGNLMLNIINNVLEAEQIESERITYLREPMALMDVFNELLETFEGLANLKNIAISACCDRRLMVFIDRNRIIRVFHNLIINALHHTLEGGRIEISTVPSGDDKSVILRVSDTGTGIKPEIKERIFEKFVGSPGGSRGTGLGLYIVRSFLQGHGSTIEMESTPGRGTVFSFTLPIAAYASCRP
ncbi:MAG: ATP-binding protein [Candidatus Eremiobacteraeota bacterium]|nr:ATP-binding protein [Candidatus Eremiobacteraeota bacterium]